MSEVTKRCRLSWLINEPKYGRRRGAVSSQQMSTAVHVQYTRAQTIFGDLTPLTYMLYVDLLLE
jgi:hypothetical protein